MIFSVKNNCSGITIFPAVWEGKIFMEMGVRYSILQEQENLTLLSPDNADKCVSLFCKILLCRGILAVAHKCWAIRSWHSKKEKFDFSLFRFSEKFQINRCIRGLAAMSSHRFQKNETPRPPNLASLNGGLVVKSNLSINILINYAHIIKRQRELKTKSILTFIGNFQLFIITGSV
jgi:hypothetical protein